jgi:flagellin FlaB
VRLYRDEKGVTGLETAIILIAFVVVASVFAYTVLSAGIFSSQRGQEAVYAGLQQARSSLEPRGSVIAYKGTVGSTSTVVKVAFTVSKAVGGEKIDLTPPYTVVTSTGAITTSGLNHVTLVSYNDDSQFISDAAWTVSFVGKSNGDYLLDSEEKAVITVWLVNYDGSSYSLGSGSSDPWIDSAGNLLSTYEDFTIEVKPPEGSTLSIARTTPARLDTVMDLK